MIEGFAAVLRQHEVKPRGIRAIGAMADLVPRHQLAEITTLLAAPYVNTFGATETGLPPATGSFIPIGAAPTDLAKRQSAFCEVRLVDPDDQRRAGRRARRMRDPRPDPVQRLLAGARGQRQGLPRRLVPHGRRVRAASPTAGSISSTAPST